MSTPIETNTEQLQEVLQQVYNLPSRSGGNTKYDMTINLSGEFWVSDSSDYKPSEKLTVTFDESEFRNTAEKLYAGESASIIVRGELALASGDPEPVVMYPTFIKPSAHDSTTGRTHSLYVTVIIHNSYTGGACGILTIGIFDGHGIQGDAVYTNFNYAAIK